MPLFTGSWLSSLIVTIALNNSETQNETDNTNKKELSNQAQNKQQKKTFETKESESFRVVNQVFNVQTKLFSLHKMKSEEKSNSMRWLQHKKKGKSLSSKG